MKKVPTLNHRCSTGRFPISHKPGLSEAPLPPGEGLGRGFGRSVLTQDSRWRLHAPIEPSSGASHHLLTHKGTPKGSPEGEGPNQLSFEADQTQGCTPRRADARRCEQNAKGTLGRPYRRFPDRRRPMSGTKMLTLLFGTIEQRANAARDHLASASTRRQKSVCGSHPDTSDVC
jgi:hypothetical protein